MEAGREYFPGPPGTSLWVAGTTSGPAPGAGRAGGRGPSRLWAGGGSRAGKPETGGGARGWAWWGDFGGELFFSRAGGDPGPNPQGGGTGWVVGAGRFGFRSGQQVFPAPVVRGTNLPHGVQPLWEDPRGFRGGGTAKHFPASRPVTAKKGSGGNPRSSSDFRGAEPGGGGSPNPWAQRAGAIPGVGARTSIQKGGQACPGKRGGGPGPRGQVKPDGDTTGGA